MRTHVYGMVALLALVGCGGSESANPSSPDARLTADARPGADAASGTPGTPDAKPGTPDAKPGTPDAKPGTADAAPGGGGTADAPAGGGGDTPDAAGGGGGDTPDAAGGGGGTPDAAGGGGGDTPDAAGGGGGGTPDAPVATADRFHYVMSALHLGSTQMEAMSYGFDLDGDGHVDNALGVAAATVNSLSGLDLDSALAGVVHDGTIVILDALDAVGLTAADPASWQIYVGEPQPNPDLTSGNGMFKVAATSPTDAIVDGAIAAGQFAGGPSPITLDLALFAGMPPIRVHILAAHVQADVTEAGCTGGKLGGGIPQADIDGQIIPAVAMLLNQYVASHPSSAAQILGVFDTNHDGTISADEVASNFLVQLLLAPDVDLLDADGNPGHDGTPDSLSAGIGFSCTKAIFDEPVQ